MAEVEWRVQPGPDGGVAVVAAVTAVMSELPSIGKADKSPEGYQYRGIEAITQHLQPLLARHGAFLAPRARVLSVVPSPAMKDGWQDTTVEVDWLIVGPDGSSVTATTSGIGRDRSDKGANKGQTQAYKYLLLALFCIADRKDDADGMTYEDGRAEGGQLAEGEMLAKDAKAQVVAAVEGDKEAATQAWQAAGLHQPFENGRPRWKVTQAELDQAIAEAARLTEAATEGVAQEEQQEQPELPDVDNGKKAYDEASREAQR